MKVAYMHYHLKTGGVTTVIRQQLAALAGQVEQLVITGQPPQAPLVAATVHIPELAYSSRYDGTFRPEDAARSIIQAISSRFGGPCDLLHVHNPTLAKNRCFLDILKLLQQAGINLLLQIHDFGEDGRPSAYFSEAYPQNCHYGVINQRDFGILRKAGLKPDGLHMLANTVTVPAAAQSSAFEMPMALYPIRAIRRKNAGEAILLSRFLKPERTVAVTLPPNSPADIDSYELWKRFVQAHGLNVVFDLGLHHDFAGLVASAEFLITTSISEGFGFSFLEPWLHGKLLWGRKLTEICRDFEGNGIRFEHLYSSLDIPVDWIDLGRFKSNWHQSVKRACRLFEVFIDEVRVRDAFDEIISDGVVDFGLLDESSQKKTILRIMPHGKAAERLIRLNPFLAAPGTVADAVSLIDHNRRTILRAYNPDGYRQNLMRVYRKVSAHPVEHRIDKAILASAFIDLKNFSLLKWADDPGLK